MENFDQNPIILVDDDIDDLEIATEAISSLGYFNKIVTWQSGDEFLSSLELHADVPFIIICDLNMPKRSGLEIRKVLAKTSDIRHRTIPFVLWSTGATNSQIREAFDLWSQGVFKKPSSMDEMKLLLATVLEYWRLSGHPQKRQNYRS